jgi:hypothetical protein
LACFAGRRAESVSRILEMFSALNGSIGQAAQLRLLVSWGVGRGISWLPRR